MAHIVTSKCAGCRFTDCVEVCPVACFYKLGNQVVIDPDECIDCTACIAECPVEAIYGEDNLPKEFEGDIPFNAEESAMLKAEGAQSIAEIIPALPTAEARKKELGY